MNGWDQFVAWVDSGAFLALPLFLVFLLLVLAGVLALACEPYFWLRRKLGKPEPPESASVEDVCLIRARDALIPASVRQDFPNL